MKLHHGSLTVTFVYCKYEQLKDQEPGARGLGLARATIGVRKHVRDSACHVIERDALGRVCMESRDRQRCVRFTSVTVRE